MNYSKQAVKQLRKLDEMILKEIEIKYPEYIIYSEFEKMRVLEKELTSRNSLEEKWAICSIASEIRPKQKTYHLIQEIGEYIKVKVIEVLNSETTSNLKVQSLWELFEHIPHKDQFRKEMLEIIYNIEKDPLGLFKLFFYTAEHILKNRIFYDFKGLANSGLLFKKILFLEKPDFENLADYKQEMLEEMSERSDVNFTQTEMKGYAIAFSGYSRQLNEILSDDQEKITRVLIAKTFIKIANEVSKSKGVRILGNFRGHAYLFGDQKPKIYTAIAGMEEIGGKEERLDTLRVKIPMATDIEDLINIHKIHKKVFIEIDADYLNLFFKIFSKQKQLSLDNLENIFYISSVYLEVFDKLDSETQKSFLLSIFRIFGQSFGMKKKLEQLRNKKISSYLKIFESHPIFEKLPKHLLERWKYLLKSSTKGITQDMLIESIESKKDFHSLWEIGKQKKHNFGSLAFNIWLKKISSFDFGKEQTALVRSIISNYLYNREKVKVSKDAEAIFLENILKNFIPILDHNLQMELKEMLSF